MDPGTPRDIGLLNELLCRAIGLGARVKRPKLFTTLARHRKLFRRWLVFASGLMPFGTLSRRDTEIVILRVGHRMGCAYEIRHHERLARAAGLRNDELVALGDDARGVPWSARDRSLIEFVDDLHAHRRVQPATWEALTAHFREDECIELCLLVGHYQMLAQTIETLGIEID